MADTQADGTKGEEGAGATLPPTGPTDYGNLLEDALLGDGEGTKESIVDDDTDDLDDDNEEDDDQDEDEDDDGSDDATASADSDEDDSEPVVDPKLARWAERLIENPRRLSQIPGEQRTQVVALALERQKAMTEAAEREMARQAIPGLLQDAYKRGRNDASQELSSTADFRELEQLEEEDPAAFAELGKREPGKLRRFYQWKESGQAERETGITGELQADLNAAHRKMTPELRAWLEDQQRRQPGIYANTAAGAARFLRDVERASLELSQKQAREEAEARQKAEERKRAAEKRKQLPKPETTGANGRSKPLPTTVNDLIAVGWEQDLQKLKR